MTKTSKAPGGRNDVNGAAPPLVVLTKSRVANPFIVGFCWHALNRLGHFGPILRWLWSSRPSLRSFLRFRADARDQPGNADDSGDNDENNVLIEVHASAVLNSKSLERYMEKG